MPAHYGAPARAVRAHEELFAYWASLRHDARLPGRQDIEPGAFTRLLPAVSLIDVYRDPLDYRLRLAGTGLYGIYNTAAADYWRVELGKVVQDGRPVVGVQNLGWRGASHLSVLWLRLPLASNGRDVDMILGYDTVIGLPQIASGIRAA
jgi:hypothetical protein